jgi:hypothetical protein
MLGRVSSDGGKTCEGRARPFVIFGINLCLYTCLRSLPLRSSNGKKAEEETARYEENEQNKRRETVAADTQFVSRQLKDRVRPRYYNFLPNERVEGAIDARRQ